MEARSAAKVELKMAEDARTGAVQMGVVPRDMVQGEDDVLTDSTPDAMGPQVLVRVTPEGIWSE